MPKGPVTALSSSLGQAQGTIRGPGTRPEPRGWHALRQEAQCSEQRSVLQGRGPRHRETGQAQCQSRGGDPEEPGLVGL